MQRKLIKRRRRFATRWRNNFFTGLAIVLPIEPIIAHCNERGIETLIDGSHGVGLLPLDLDTLGATYYTSRAKG